MTSQLRDPWLLDEAVTYLNHGSFGACPLHVLELQDLYRRRMEREPVDFFTRRLPGLLDEARGRVARFVGAQPENLVFVRNATEGVNAVLGSLALRSGDEILLTDHGYNACRNAASHVAGRTGARVRTASVPFPLGDPEQVVKAVLAALSPRTRLALLDHVTSPTGLVFPVQRLAQELSLRGVDLLVDGAHAPGMLELDLEALGQAGVSYYAGNFHKWCCSPKGAGMLWVRPDRQAGLHPPVISHGYNSRRNRARFLEEFDWVGTDDPTPWLCVPESLVFVGDLLPGGWPSVRRRNRQLVLEGRDAVAAALGVEPPAPDSMIGSLAALPLPDAVAQEPSICDALQQQLHDQHHIEVPIAPWPAFPRRWIRLSAFLYNVGQDYLRLAQVLPTCLDRQGQR